MEKTDEDRAPGSHQCLDGQEGSKAKKNKQKKSYMVSVVGRKPRGWMSWKLREENFLITSVECVEGLSKTN